MVSMNVFDVATTWRFTNLNSHVDQNSCILARGEIAIRLRRLHGVETMLFIQLRSIVVATVLQHQIRLSRRV